VDNCGFLRWSWPIYGIRVITKLWLPLWYLQTPPAIPFRHFGFIAPNIFSVPDEGYSRNASCAVNLISTGFFSEKDWRYVSNLNFLLNGLVSMVFLSYSVLFVMFVLLLCFVSVFGYYVIVLETRILNACYTGTV
jgi:hypothetical protein